IDPISGRTLWTRSGIGARSLLFGDSEHIFVVEVTSEGQRGKAYALRAADGVKLDKVPEFSELFERQRDGERLRLLGRRILLAHADTTAAPDAKPSETKAQTKPAEVKKETTKEVELKKDDPDK